MCVSPQKQINLQVDDKPTVVFMAGPPRTAFFERVHMCETITALLLSLHEPFKCTL